MSKVTTTKTIEYDIEEFTKLLKDGYFNFKMDENTTIEFVIKTFPVGIGYDRFNDEISKVVLVKMRTVEEL